MRKIVWRVHPVAPLQASRYCKKCGKKQDFSCSGQFRVNAQRRSLDIWLIYKCANCDATWNAAIYSRIPPQSLPPGLLDGFHKNDRELVWRYAMDAGFLGKNGAEAGLAEFSVSGDDFDFGNRFGPAGGSGSADRFGSAGGSGSADRFGSAGGSGSADRFGSAGGSGSAGSLGSADDLVPGEGETIQLEITSDFQLPVKVSSILREKLRMSKREFSEMTASGAIRSVPGQDLQKCKLNGGSPFCFQSRSPFPQPPLQKATRSNIFDSAPDMPAFSD